MASKTVEIKNETGLHTRPGNEFVSLAKTFNSQIEVENEAGKREKAAECDAWTQEEIRQERRSERNQLSRRRYDEGEKSTDRRP